MSKEQNLRVFNEWIAAHRDHDIEKMLTYLTEDVTIKSAAGPNMPPAKGKSEAGMHWRTIFDAFPDFKMNALSTTCEEEIVFAEISHGGTMKGKMGGKEPTGKSYRLNGAFRIDFDSGKIKSILSYWDTNSQLAQLGLIPTP